jgi:DNA-binding NarL/FixJ family response regulator
VTKIDVMVLVALVATHAALRANLAALIGSDRSFSLVVADGDGAPDVLAMAGTHRPDVLLLATPGALASRGLLVRRVRLRHPRTAVVVAGSLPGPIGAANAGEAGAFAYVPLEGLGPELLDTLGAAAASVAL